MPSPRPIVSLALTAGVGRPSRPGASSPARPAARSWRSISPGCASPCGPAGPPWSARDMEPAKGVAPRQATFTRLPSRPPKPTVPNAPWPPSADHLGLSSIGAAKAHPRTPSPQPTSWLTAASDSTRTTQPRSLDLLTTMVGGTTRRSIEHLRNERRAAQQAAPPLAPSNTSSEKIDKSQLTIGEPKRLRDKEHLKFVASQPCLVCSRQPCDAHHLRFAQPRATGMKVSDEFTVPLCRGHHRQLHEAGNEIAWWEDLEINALEIARGLWEETHPRTRTDKSAPDQAHSVTEVE